MKRVVLQELLSRYGNVSRASRLSGYARRSYYYKPEVSTRNPRLDAELLEAIEGEALEHPSYGVRRITVMLKRKGIHANRKKVYRLMKIANLIKRRSVRKHIARRTITIPVRSNHVWEQDITYVWCGKDGWCYLFNIIDCYTREWLAYTFSRYCGTGEAISTLDKAVLERFPDGMTRDGLTIRNDGGPPVHIRQVHRYSEEVWNGTGSNGQEQARSGCIHRGIAQVTEGRLHMAARVPDI